MKNRVFDIEICYFVEDGVWLATSDEIRGLTVEADSLQGFVEALIDVSAELLAHNHGLSEAEIEETTIRVSEFRRLRNDSELPDNETTRRRATPKLMVNDPIGLVAAAA